MNRFFILIIIHLLSFDLSAQSIPDKEFSWTNIGAVSLEKEAVEVFVKVEQNPTIDQYNQNQFEAIIQKSIDALQLSNKTSGLMKFKINFIKDQGLKLVKIGLQGMTLTDFQANLLRETFDPIKEMTPGNQRNILVHCQGILYLTISNGKLTKMKNVNFNFAN